MLDCFIVLLPTVDFSFLILESNTVVNSERWTLSLSHKPCSSFLIFYCCLFDLTSASNLWEDRSHIFIPCVLFDHTSISIQEKVGKKLRIGVSQSLISTIFFLSIFFNHSLIQYFGV